MKERILGIDVARAIAVIGMIIVNFKIVLGDQGDARLKALASIFDGKAAATFVVLAGVGLALMTNSAIQNDDHLKLTLVRKRILKRAFFLFLIGLSYIVVWPADILHFYGVYMLIVILLLKKSANVILASSFGLIAVYPLLLSFFEYEKGWDFNTLNYLDFWTVKGFVRNLFFNGFHPVIPWASFMLFGFWFGKQDLSSDRFLKKSLWNSLVSFFAIQIISHFTIKILANGNEEVVKKLSDLIGTHPMPPLPIYMLNGIAISVSIISACILIAKRFPHNKIILALNKTGQLALTFYVAHVILGMGLIEAINPNKMGDFSIGFSLVYALGFSLLCILFAVLWLKFKRSGPIEWVMRKLIN